MIGYATSRPSRDVVVAAHQELTREWMALRASAFDLFVSQLVIVEAAFGDRSAAQPRTDFLSGIPRLSVTEAAASLATRLVDAHAVPRKAVEDALHIAVAAVHGVDFLLTWNCRHIANAANRLAIQKICRAAGYEPTVICTPEELMDDEPA